MPQRKAKKRTRCAECKRKRGELVRFRGRWICAHCLNPDWTPSILAPLLSSSAGDLLEHGQFQYGESQRIYEAVRKNGVKSKFALRLHLGEMPKDERGKFTANQ